ncbi:DeoR/GlpR family DNA-binding transcription regulator [Oceanotoga sp. DSM 15011]|uniref:DeoR/GlpR family DNA-binding transcription regulator n=1 Tax=unclassified Oceanotoga TaxID=2618448 RepID=UPI0021F3E135|nr:MULTISPECIES: DeoR/GlpR family DNA-binding transcription regulator [unclassified Oceanotoga]MDN5343287.1 DeoR family transcriptional regulator, fructose operon transcriptional repressor [Oceanotoga sp.]UYP01149.1 DeoR/GlpR family DNA-binding transcription regulator [Oceanotoga sp. DSM 15011]
MLKEIRHSKILQLIKDNKTISTKKIAKELKSPEVTIRKDLAYLEKLGKINRIHGGASIIEKSMISELTMQEKKVKNIELKKKIAKNALSLIKKNDYIFLDSGSTTLEISELILKHIDFQMTVFTNSIEILSKLSLKNNIDLYVIGNHLRKKTGAFVFSDYDDDITEKMILSKSFIGANAFDSNFAYTPTSEEAKIKNKMIEISQTPILIADSTKTNTISLWKISEIQKFKMIITDEKTELIKELEEEGLKIII